MLEAKEIPKKSFHEDIDLYISHLLEGKEIKKIETEAFPDIFIWFKDGTLLRLEFETSVSNREDGDEENLNLYVSKNNDEIFEDTIKRTYRTSSGFY